MNIFLYPESEVKRSNSSCIDYALSVKKPIAISNSHMFQHIYDDCICVYKTPIQEIMKTSVEYCKQFLTKFSNEELCKKMKYIIEGTPRA